MDEKCIELLKQNVAKWEEAASAAEALVPRIADAGDRRYLKEIRQKNSWVSLGSGKGSEGEDGLLRDAMSNSYREHGKIYCEYSIPRLGRRIDVVAVIGPVIFALEFKVYEETFTS